MFFIQGRRRRRAPERHNLGVVVTKPHITGTVEDNDEQQQKKKEEEDRNDVIPRRGDNVIQIPREIVFCYYYKVY